MTLKNQLGGINQSQVKPDRNYTVAYGLRIDSTKDDVDSILEIEPCPNCGKDMIDGKCEDSVICGVGHGQDYLSQKEEERLKKSLYMMGNGEKFEMKTLSNNKFYFYNYYGRIKENTAELEMKIEGIKYFVNIGFNIIDNGGGKIISNIVFNGKIKKKINNKKIDVYFDYNKMIKYILIVLNDYRFNKFIKS